MCQFGMTAIDVDGSWQLVVKPTGWAANSDQIAKQLARRCTNKEEPPWRQHRHVELVGNKAKGCEVYPIEL
eukprot:6582050-Pyramimonas_sp.AAC.1